MKKLLFLSLIGAIVLSSCVSTGYNANGCRKAVPIDSPKSLKHFAKVKS